MKQSIGAATILNIIIVFILVTFGLLAATFSYARAYKVNTRIMNGIEIYEGYNNGSLGYINNFLGSIGYTKGAKKDCPQTLVMNRNTGSLVKRDEKYYYCIYRFDSTTEGDYYYSYGVVTYITFDLPIVGKFDLPVRSKTNRIYNFDKNANSQKNSQQI